MTRSNRLLAVGAVVTLLGAVLVLAVLTLQSPADPVVSDAPSSSSEPTTTAGAEDGPASDDPAAATATPSALRLPDGMEAVALTVDFEGSVAGLPEVGDRVHVYGVPSAGSVRSEDDGGTRISRLLEDVEVLAITGADHTTNGGNPTVVLGVDPGDVGATLSSHGTTTVHLTLVERASGSAEEGSDGSQAAEGTDTPEDGA